MKKTQKKVLGLLGLFLVAAATVFAAFLPGPQATATSSVTDTVIVRVVGTQPNVEIVSDLKNGATIVHPEQNITVNYEEIKHLTVTVKYTDKDGVVHTIDLVDQDTTEGPGSLPLNLDFSQGEFGYGEYVITVKGEGEGGITDETNLKFSYIAVVAETAEDEKTGDPVLKLDYEPDDGTPEGEGKVSTIVINIYDEDGNLIKPSPITVTAPDKEVVLPFSDYDLASGKYKIVIEAYDRNDNLLYRTVTLYCNYKTTPVPDTDDDGKKEEAKVPDTGGLFQNSNISNSDYLVTGLLIFLIVGVGGAVFIVKRDRKARKH